MGMSETQRWQHGETGRICEKPIGEWPGEGWSMVGKKTEQVPPGWVRLTRQDGCQPELLPTNGARVTVDESGLGALVMYVQSGWCINVCEPFAEVAALIAEAEAAERRANVVAAFVDPQGSGFTQVTADGQWWNWHGASIGWRPIAAPLPILDAIEREWEGSDD